MTYKGSNGIVTTSSFRVLWPSSDFALDFIQTLSPNFISLISEDEVHNAFGIGDKKLYTVEAGTFNEKSSIDEAFLNEQTNLYEGFYWQKDRSEIEYYFSWEN